MKEKIASRAALGRCRVQKFHSSMNTYTGTLRNKPRKLISCYARLARAVAALAAAVDGDLGPHVEAAAAAATGAARASALAALADVLVAVVAAVEVDVAGKVTSGVERAVIRAAAVRALDGDPVRLAVVDLHHALVVVDVARVQVVVALVLEAARVVQVDVRVLVLDDEVLTPAAVPPNAYS